LKDTDTSEENVMKYQLSHVTQTPARMEALVMKKTAAAAVRTDSLE